MKKAVLAAAMLCVVGSAQAYTVVSDTVGASHVDLGVTNIGGYHGPLGAPGIAVHGSGAFISLQSIAGFTYVGVETENGTDFSRHELAPGFIHTNPGPGETPLGIGLVGLAVPKITEELYFGIASTTTGTPGVNSHQAWYVGDQDNLDLPAGATDYDAIALVAFPTDAINTPQVLKGTLSVDNALQLSGDLDNGSAYLAFATSTTTGSSFTGNLEYHLGSASGNNGTYNGQFFGDASIGESALAGVASGTYGGDAYVVSFGGIEQ